MHNKLSKFFAGLSGIFLMALIAMGIKIRDDGKKIEALNGQQAPDSQTEAGSEIAGGQPDPTALIQEALDGAKDTIGKQPTAAQTTTKIIKPATTVTVQTSSSSSSSSSSSKKTKSS